MDTGGRLIIPSARAPDVEMTEYLYPLVALWRREQTDSGGPGRQRGGMSGSVCYVQHPDQTGTMSLVVSGTGKAANQNVGLAGGHPGNSQLDLVVRGIDVPRLAGATAIPAGLDELGGDIEVLPCEGESYLGPGDALYLHWQAGGGYGDPLLRPSANVRDDVLHARVSPEAARDVYGVVLREDGEVDPTATDETRAKLRQQRATGSGLPGTRPALIGAPASSGACCSTTTSPSWNPRTAGPSCAPTAARGSGRSPHGAFAEALARRDAAPADLKPAHLARPVGVRRRGDRLPSALLPRLPDRRLLPGGSLASPAARRRLPKLDVTVSRSHAAHRRPGGRAVRPIIDWW